MMSAETSSGSSAIAKHGIGSTNVIRPQAVTESSLLDSVAGFITEVQVSQH